MNYYYDYTRQYIFMMFVIGIALGFITAFMMIGSNRPILNNIQASHMNTDYHMVNNSLVIKGVEIIRTTGSSMQPTYFTDNMVITRIYNGEKLREGQIVVYKDDNNDKVSHRIKGIYPDYILLQGDNNRYAEKITRTQIERVVVGVLYE